MHASLFHSTWNSDTVNLPTESSCLVAISPAEHCIHLVLSERAGEWVGVAWGCGCLPVVVATRVPHSIGAVSLEVRCPSYCQQTPSVMREGESGSGRESRGGRGRGGRGEGGMEEGDTERKGGRERGIHLLTNC